MSQLCFIQRKTSDVFSKKKWKHTNTVRESRAVNGYGDVFWVHAWDLLLESATCTNQNEFWNSRRDINKRTEVFFQEEYLPSAIASISSPLNLLPLMKKCSPALLHVLACLEETLDLSLTDPDPPTSNLLSDQISSWKINLTSFRPRSLSDLDK